MDWTVTSGSSSIVAAALVTTLVPLAFAAVFIGLTIWGSKFAYNHGKQTGNMTVSVILIAIGVVVAGITLIPGIFHLIGTTKATQKSNPFEGMGKGSVKVRCPNCKTLVDESATFCSGCGEKLS